VIQVRLREVSSSADNTLADAAGWFTTLTRAVNTGVPVNYRIQFPTTDGAVVDGNYIAKIYFDKSLGFAGGQPIPPAQLVSEFSVTLDGALIPRSSYTFIRDETGSESALAFRFPTFYSGNADDLHELRATHLRGDVSLTDVRQVRAAPGAVLDSDGDGLPDFWEDRYRLEGSNPDGEHGALGDRDGDGAINSLEFLAGSDPNVPADGAAVLYPRIARSGGSWRLTFPVLPNRRYQVQTSANLLTWENAGSSFTVPAANFAHEWLDPSPAAAQRFYRVRLQLQ
jgi:hypothetical protein